MHRTAAVVTAVFVLACGGSGGPTSVAEAEPLCAKGDPAGCIFLGEFFEKGPPSNRTDEPAAWVTYLDQTCGRGHAGYCGVLGEIRLTGVGGDKDQPVAAELLKKSCEGGTPRSCYTLGVQRRLADGIDKDLEGAKAMFEKACEGKVFQGCANVGQMYTTNELGAQDWDAARPWYQKACDLSEEKELCEAAKKP